MITVFLERSKKYKGFTLVELLVSTAIFLILSTVVLVNFHRNKRTQELEYQTKKVLTIINQAQNLALTGQKTAGLVPYYGLHVTLDNRYFIIFADTDGDFIRNIDESEDLAGNKFYLGGKLQIIDEVDDNASTDLLFEPSTGELYNSTSSRIISEFLAFTVSEVLEPTNKKEIYINGRVGRVVEVR